MASNSVEKRKRSRNSDISLTGKPIERSPGTKLPSRGDALRVSFNLHNSNPELKQSIKKTAEISEVWDKAKIPTVIHA